MKIEFTREELHLIRRALDFYKSDNEILIESLKENNFLEPVELFEEDNRNAVKLSNKLTAILYECHE